MSLAERRHLIGFLSRELALGVGLSGCSIHSVSSNRVLLLPISFYLNPIESKNRYLSARYDGSLLKARHEISPKPGQAWPTASLVPGYLAARDLHFDFWID